MLLALAACLTRPRPSFGDQIQHLASYPELCDVVLGLAEEARDPGLIPFAERVLDGAEAGRRRLCYRLLTRTPWAGQRQALLQGLADPSPRVQAACVSVLHENNIWDAAIRDELWSLVATSTDGHVVGLAGEQLVRKDGQAAAMRLYETLVARGDGWPPVALATLARHPLPSFFGVFEQACRSSDFDAAILGRRGLLALGEVAMVADPEVARLPTWDEWASEWRIGDCGAAAVARRQEWVARARSARVVIVGETHGLPTEHAAEIELVSELYAAHGQSLVLLHELPLYEEQLPVILAAKRLDLEVRVLESGAEPSSPVRDVVARRALQDMVVAEPEKRFLVIYGDLHLRSFHAAMREVDVDAVAVVHRPSGSMFTDAIKLVGWRVQDHVFRYPGDFYYAPKGSYGAVLGAPKLDDVLMAAGW